MKLKTTFFILLASICFIAKAQYVTIPDANFAAWLNSNIPSAMINGNQMDTTSLDVTTLTSIDVNNLSISNLDGIQYFSSLQNLNCSGDFMGGSPNLLTNIPPLPGSLISLNCEGNLLASLPALPNTLSSLACGNNMLTSLPVLPGSLTTLDCSGNSLTSIGTIPNLVSSINCASNQLTSLPALPGALTFLECRYNQLTALPSLPLGITHLYCGSNPLTSLPVLPDALTLLACDNSQLTSLPLLPNSLTALHCSFNQLTALPTLPSFITQLQCDNNQLSLLPDLPMLSALSCSNNQLTNLPVLPISLQTFRCDNNNIFCFPIFPVGLSNSVPEDFNISGNPFTCLPNYIPSMDSQTLAYPLCLENDFINNPAGCIGAKGIFGDVYYDSDNNCQYNSGIEHTLSNILLKLYDSTNTLKAQRYSFSNGIYNFPDTVGVYTVKVDTSNLPYTVGCPIGIDSTVNLMSGNSLAKDVNFPLTCKSGYDLGIQSIIPSGWVFPGQQHQANILAGDMSQWYNLRCAQGASGQVQLSISGPVTYTGVTPNALTPGITGNTFTYQISDFGTVNNSEAFGLLFTTDTTAQSGDVICVTATVTSSGNDNNTTNNTYQFCYNVINSYDPNMKEVYPVNVLPGYQDWFTYTIHFQNTGSAPAFNIRLADTLDSNFDLETFQVINYSHYNTVSLQNNALSFRFPNIMLPDSTTNSEGSKGFVQYRIKPKPNMSLGTQIPNTAFIYFDYNSAIVTNTTINEFTQPLSVKEAEIITLNIYPNPGTGKYYIKLPETIKSRELSLNVYNLLGEIVSRVNSSEVAQSDGKTLFIDISSQPNGIYFIQGKLNGRNCYQRIVKQ